MADSKKHLEFSVEGDDLVVTMSHRVSLAWFFDIARQIFNAVGYVIIKKVPEQKSIQADVKHVEDNSEQG